MNTAPPVDGVEGQRLWEVAWGKPYPKQTITVGESTFKYYETQSIDFWDNKIEPILFIRPEYVTTWEYIQSRTERAVLDGSASRAPAFVVTGQPGIGKTLFLLYLLIERLKRREATAVQLDANAFVLFDRDGARLFSGNKKRVIPAGAWALSDSDETVTIPCLAFLRAKAVRLQTSSLQSRRWHEWAKQHDAQLYVMDLWTSPEIEALLELFSLNVAQGLALAHKWGPCARTTVVILRQGPDTEVVYRANTIAAAQQVIEDCAGNTTFDALDFSGREARSSVLFVRRASGAPGLASLCIPTLEIAKILAKALVRFDNVAQNQFFTRMSGHASSRTAAGWIYASFMHARLTSMGKYSVLAVDQDGQNLQLPMVRRIESGTFNALRSTDLPFYWRPSSPSFPGVDAVICHADGVYALQATTSQKHTDVSTGLSKIRSGFASTIRSKPLHLVFVSPSLQSAEILRNMCKLQRELAHVHIWACELMFLTELADVDQMLDEASDSFEFIV